MLLEIEIDLLVAGLDRVRDIDTKGTFPFR